MRRLRLFEKSIKEEQFIYKEFKKTDFPGTICLKKTRQLDRRKKNMILLSNLNKVNNSVNFILFFNNIFFKKVPETKSLKMWFEENVMEKKTL